MATWGSIFLDISLPNAPTWFYFSALLAVALFVRFARLLSIRNWDILTLFLPAPGLLLLTEPESDGRWGYVWLMAASGYFFVRCLVDLALVRRPSLNPNLSMGGMIWLMGALYVSLIAVAARPPVMAAPPVEPPASPIEEIRRQGERLLQYHTGTDVDDPTVRVWIERGLTLLCHLVVVLGLVVVGKWHFDSAWTGAAAATAYLLLPYTFLLVPGAGLGVGRWDHAWPMALLIWAVAGYRRPAVSGLLLGLAAGTVIFPALTFPVWFSFYFGRGAGRFTLAFLFSSGTCLAVILGLFWLHGELPESLRSTWNLSTWLPWREPPADAPSFWQLYAAHSSYRLPVFIAYVGFVLTTFFWPSPKNLAHVIALSAAILVGVQFWYADQGGLYVLWYLPYLLLLAFRPNLSSAVPPATEADWLVRAVGALGQWLRRPFHRRAAAPVD